MFRRIWYFLREVAWTAVLAVAFSVAGLALAVLGYGELGLTAVGTGITLAVVSTRA